MDGVTYSSREDIANVIGETFSAVSNSINYPPAFLTTKLRSENTSINFNSLNTEAYNTDFTKLEMMSALSLTPKTSPGQDGISYVMLKHLSNESLKSLLFLYNRIWKECSFPNAWGNAIVIPIAKPGKDPKNPSNYRPIALTSCLCKIMEKMVNRHLTHYLENNHCLLSYQSCFRRGRSSLDNVLFLETAVRNAFAKRNHVVSVFFDMEKAYDRTWRHGTLHDLYSTGLRSNLPDFIQNFLRDRTFQVKMGSLFSRVFAQQEGVLQGSVLSVTLFSLKINSILRELLPTVHGSMYVDDLMIYCHGQDMRYIERQLQIALNRIVKWSNNNGFKFATQKTVCVHFCRKRNLHPEPELHLDGSLIRVEPEAKFLGVIFDRKLTFLLHILNLKKKCIKTLNILKFLANTSWGAECCSMLRIYRALIRSKLDYGCIIYGLARPSVLLKLDTVHHQAVRTCCGAFKTSPVQSLYVICSEPSLEFRRKQLSLEFHYKIMSRVEHPARLMTSDRYWRLYQARPSCIPPFDLCVLPLIKELNLSDLHPKSFNLFGIAPWQDLNIQLLDIFGGLKENNTNDIQYQQIFLEHRSSHSNYTAIFTDGSKNHDYVGAAFVCEKIIKTSTLHKAASAFMAETLAILNSLNFISKQNNKKFIIYSDSLSALESINTNTSHPLVLDILKVHLHLRKAGYSIAYCWVPGHVGIKGNELADAAAKSADSTSENEVPFTDIRNYIKAKILSRWQELWKNQTLNKLRQVKPNLEYWESRGNRKEDVLLTRLRIGHCRLTHQHLLKGDKEPICGTCNTPISVNHILTCCPIFNQKRDHHFNSTNVKLTDLIGRKPHFVAIEGFVTAIVDMFPKYLRVGYRREYFIAATCFVSFLIGLSMVTNNLSVTHSVFNEVNLCKS
ncbi:RNA-directed DNA polymerase from mobile element jockey, partial [Stegodyphus mimosarum]